MAAETATSNPHIEAISTLISTDPPLFITPNPSLSLSSRLASQYLFTSLKPYTPKSPFDHLLIDGFDSEQIWQQIDIQSQPLISSLKREISKFEKDPYEILRYFGGNEVSGGIEEDFEVGLNGDGEDLEESEDGGDGESEEEESEEEGDEEEGESEEEDVGEDEDGVPEVEDEFLKVKELERFLVREEKREYGGEEKKKKKGKGGNEQDEDEEDESEEDLDEDNNEILMYGGAGNDEEEEDNIRYEDFFVPNKKTPMRKQRQADESHDSDMKVQKNMPKRKQENVEESDGSETEESDDSEMEDANDEQIKENLSTYEKERQKIQDKIKQMEEANLAPKDWTMQGEITASKRPRDSALEVDLDFEHNVRPPPVITEEVTESLEEIIKKRILEGNFDDVQKAPKLPYTAPKERKELDDNKSKKGLAEIYEDEYAHQTGLASAPLSHNEELRKEASDLFKRLCLKLDALSHFHFAPKPVVEDMSIQMNVPALAMEEVAPVAVSDAAMLAPEEVFAGKGDIKEDNELTKEDRKRRRANKKRKFKAINATRATNRTVQKTLPNPSEDKEV